MTVNDVFCLRYYLIIDDPIAINYEINEHVNNKLLCNDDIIKLYEINGVINVRANKSIVKIRKLADQKIVKAIMKHQN